MGNQLTQSEREALSEDFNPKKLRRSLRNKAIYALARREHSSHEMRQKLAKVVNSDEAFAAEAVNTLIDEGLLSDQRFAEQLCRTRFNRGFGPARLRYELDQHRIAAELLEQSMAEYDEQWLDRLREVKEKKYGAAIAADYKGWAKQARFLQSRGFTSAQINAVLKRP